MTLPVVALNSLNRLLLVLGLVVLCSCASKKNVEVVQRSTAYEEKVPLSIAEQVSALIDSKEDIEASDKIKLKATINECLQKNVELKKMESQLLQLYFDDLLVNKVSDLELQKVKRELKQVYQKKYAIINDASKEMNHILGRNLKNKELTTEFIKAFRDMR